MSNELFLPEVWRCKVDGTVAVEAYPGGQELYRLVWRGPTATRLFPPDVLVSREFLIKVYLFDFERLDNEAEAYKRGEANAEDRLAPEPPEGIT